MLENKFYFLFVIMLLIWWVGFGSLDVIVVECGIYRVFGEFFLRIF